MTFTFLQEEIETILLFATAPIYFTIVGILQSKNLKAIEKIKSKKTTNEEKIQIAKRLRKLKLQTPFIMLIGLIAHSVSYSIIEWDTIRDSYFISMIIMYVIYTLIAEINFYLKGAGILKDIGDFNGLPGN